MYSRICALYKWNVECIVILQMRYKQNQFAHKENEGNEIIFVHFGVAEIEILLYYSLFFDLFTSILK